MNVQDGSNTSSPDRAPRPRRGWIIAAIGVLALLGGAGTLVYAGEGFWNHDHGGRMNPERMAKHIGHGVKFVLSEVDATADQKAQVTAILQAAATDVHALADRHHADIQQLRDILAAQTIDRTRLEAVRRGELRLADEASQRILRGLADAAEVLTPQQRTALAEHMEQHGHWRGHQD
jgi:periplasmic protein CpxP/Spy